MIFNAELQTQQIVRQVMRLFLSFYFSEDALLAKEMMDVWLNFPEAAATAFIEEEEIQLMQKEGFPRIYNWIEKEVEKADVVLVVIGDNTQGRHFVEYEIAIAQKLGKPMLGVRWKEEGESPLLPVFPEYNWLVDEGIKNLESWVVSAFHNKQEYYDKIGKLFEAIVASSKIQRRQLRAD